MVKNSTSSALEMHRGSLLFHLYTLRGYCGHNPAGVKREAVDIAYANLRGYFIERDPDLISPLTGLLRACQIRFFNGELKQCDRDYKLVEEGLEKLFSKEQMDWCI